MVAHREKRDRWPGFSRMRELLLLVTSVAFVLTACGSVLMPEASVSIAVEVPATPIATNEKSEPEPATSPSAFAVSAAANTGDCGYSAGLQPDRIEIAQIPGGGREEVVSAIDFPDDSSFGVPLADVNRIVGGALHQTGSHPSMHLSSKRLPLSTGSNATRHLLSIETWAIARSRLGRLVG